MEGEGKGREQRDERKKGGNEGMCSAQLACHVVEGWNAKHPRKVVDTALQKAALKHKPSTTVMCPLVLQLERLHRRLHRRWPERCCLGLHPDPDPALLLISASLHSSAS